MDLADIGTDALILELERRDAVFIGRGEFLADRGVPDWIERTSLRLVEQVVSELCSAVCVLELERVDGLTRVSATMRVVR